MTQNARAERCFADPKAAYHYILQQEHVSQNAPININTASAADFLQLAGIGVKTAEAIVAYRHSVGRFQSVDELLHVKGIGEKTLAKNRHRLTVQ